MLLGCLAWVSTDCVEHDPMCGPGTVERDGRCVAVDEPATTMDGGITNASDDDGSDESDGEAGADESNDEFGDDDGGADNSGSASAPADDDDDDGGATYGPCPSESDVECGANEECQPGIGCGEYCDEDFECPEPDVGVPICDEQYYQCLLSCEGDTPCPAGMACEDRGGDLRCIWP
jgi:hypothetical protein